MFYNFLMEIVVEMSLSEIIAGKRRIKRDAKLHEEYKERTMRSGLYLTLLVLIYALLMPEILAIQNLYFITLEIQLNLFVTAPSYICVFNLSFSNLHI